MSWTYLRLANPNQWLLSQLMTLMLVDLIKSSLLQRLLTLPRTLGIFLETTTEGQEIRTLLNLEILGRMILLRLTTLKNLEKK